MILRHDEHELVVAVGQKLNARESAAKGADADVGAVFRHELHDLVGPHLHELDVDFGVGDEKLRDVCRQVVKGSAVVGNDADDACLVLGKGHELKLHLLDAARDLLGIAVDDAAGLGELDAAYAACQKLHAERTFEVFDVRRGA